jgi:class 3 adenylate cyclase
MEQGADLDEGGQSEAPSGTSPVSALGRDLGFYAILFSDFVRSTDLRSQLGDTEADRLHAEVDALTREAIQRNRGVAVKGLGDGIMAIFRSPSEAVQAGVTIQSRLWRRNQTSTIDLHVRIGIATSEVDVAEDDLFGYPVNEASRLCAARETGGILVAELAANLARRADVKFIEPPEILITPSAPPTVALLVETTHEEAPLIPLTGSLEFSRHGGRFVGRARELEALMEQWRRVVAGIEGAERGAGRPRFQIADELREAWGIGTT